jgi:hypothetical protein
MDIVIFVLTRLPSMKESTTTTNDEINYYKQLQDYFENSMFPTLDKLSNFPKYIPRQVLAGFLYKYELFKKIKDVQGSIIECGVYQGGGLMAFANLSSILEPVNHQRKIIGFDTFSGFKKITKYDKGSKSKYARKGGLASNSYNELIKCISVYDSNRFLNHIPKVELIKGDISNTVPKFLRENPHTVVSLLYLDVDVYEPTKIALKNFVPRMPKGSIIAFDELNSKNWVGETIATLETIGITNLRIRKFSFDPNTSYAVLE